MDNNICSGPEITRKTLIDQLFISVIHVKQKLFMSDFRHLFVLKVFNQSISRPILILHLLHFEFITTFSLILAVCQNLRSSWSPCACFVSRHVFLWSTRLLRLRRFWGQRKGHMNITERCESFVRDVKNYFPDSFSKFFPFPLHFYVKKIWMCTGRFGNIPFHLSKLRIPKFT